MIERPVHYLESTDPVRSACEPEGDFSAPSEGQVEAAAQVLMEGLLTLAMGYDIVLSQSSVIDSYACQVLVATMADAQRTGPTDAQFWLQRQLPLRLHLFGVETFPHALAAAFDRIGESSDALFVSSLYPDLQGSSSAKEIAKLADAKIHDNPLDSVSGFRADLFAATWRYFRGANRADARTVVSASPLTGQDLDSSVRLVAARHAAAPSDCVDGRIARALRAMIDASRRDQPFRYRSLLRLDAPWDPLVSSASALELAGSVSTLRLVREVVDTLYNRAVVASIGAVSATYSTPVSAGQAVELDDRAQQLALDAESRTEASFELSVARTDRDLVVSQMSSVHTEAFAAVLRDRETPRWHESLERLRNADSAKRHGEALQGHAGLLADSLQGVADVRADHRLTVKMRLSRASLAGLTAGGLEVAAAVNPLLGAALAVGAAAAPEALSAYGARRQGRATRRALGRMIGPTRR